MIRSFILPLLAVVLMLVIACEKTTSPDKAEQIVAKAIESHGGEIYLSSMIDFDFRGQHFTIQRNGGNYIYWRTQTDSSGRRIDDLMGNDFFFRCIDNVGVPLVPEYRDRYRNSLNSVVYFALLPFRLRDPAVIAKNMGTVAVKGQQYHKIEVTFRKQGGGKDFEDRFIYWIHVERFTMDYLAYRFHVDNGGVRFREAVNARRVGGLRFADYKNYQAPAETDISTMDKMFESGDLELLSTIELNNIQVNPVR